MHIPQLRLLFLELAAVLNEQVKRYCDRASAAAALERRQPSSTQAPAASPRST